MTTESLEEWYQERAAIMEHCGGLPKEKAEALARAELDGHKRAIAAADLARAGERVTA